MSDSTTPELHDSVIEPTTKTLPLHLLDQAAVRWYQRVILLFSIPNDADQAATATQLRVSLHRTLQKYPFMAGAACHVQPVDEDVGITQKGKVELRYEDPVLEEEELEDRGLFSTQVLVKDHFPHSYHDLHKAGFPPSWLRGELFDDRRRPPEEQPVLSTKANFFEGGVALSVSTHHSALDGRASNYFLAEWAKACKALGELEMKMMQCCEMENGSSGKPKTPLVATAANAESTATTAKENILAVEAMLQLGSQKADFSSLLSQCPEYTYSNGANSFMTVPPISIQATQRLFVFPVATISKLKAFVNAMVSTDLTQPPASTLSTFTCLSALLWRSIVLCKHASGRLNSNETSVFTLPVSLIARGLLPEGRSFPGNAILQATARAEVGDIVKSSNSDEDAMDIYTLVPLAKKIQAAITDVDEQYLGKRMALFAAVPDWRNFSLAAAGQITQAGVCINTWASFAAEHDFGLIGAGNDGRSDCVRKPWSPSEGYALVMPRRSNSDVWEVVVGARWEDMEVLCGPHGLGGWAEKVVE